MFFYNPWGWHIANDEMPSIDHSFPNHTAYIKSQSILLSIMTIILIFLIVTGIIFNLLLGLSIAIIALGWIVTAGWIDIIKTIKNENKNSKL